MQGESGFGVLPCVRADWVRATTPQRLELKLAAVAQGKRPAGYPLWTQAFAPAVLMGVLLCGCSTPFSQSARYDPTIVSAPGTITVSDLKLYSREALMNERARELAVLDKLIDGADSVKFVPDMVREIETFSALSASFGQTRDPIAGQNFRQAQERNAIEQDIAIIRRDIQRVQLLRDAELIRAALPAQTEPVNGDLGKSAADPPTALTSGVKAPSTEALLSRLDARMTALTAQLAAEGRPAASTTVTSNPFDEFRDRQAYRSLLYAERNARALDELHDRGSSALIRVNLQATVVPDAANPKGLGVLQVRIDDSNTFDAAARSGFLTEWLAHVNLAPGSRGADGRFTAGSAARALERARVLMIVSFAGHEVAVPSSAPEGSVGGLVVDLRGAEISRGKVLSELPGLISSWRLTPTQPVTDVLRSFCTGSLPASLQASWNDRRRRYLSEMYDARVRVLTYQYARMLEPWLEVLGDDVSRVAQVNADYKTASESLYQVAEALKTIPGCEERVATLLWQAPKVDWGSLDKRLEEATKIDRARIYEVGPREQVQQMSTVARSANSLSLAASIATGSPAAGRAAEAAAGYSRQAMGRATTLERVPSVVGYAVAGKQTFGWVLGPRTVLEPEGRIAVEQMLKPYDLSVDMSIPSWWPTLKLKVTTLWGPSPHELVQGRLNAAGRGESELEVPMRRRIPDLDWFTNLLVGRSDRLVRIESVKGGPLSACAPATLLISGRNVWRTDKVMVLGQLLEGDAIRIAPDMDGILLKVPAIPPLAGKLDYEMMLRVITPYGSHEHGIVASAARAGASDLVYAASPFGEDCKPKKAEALLDPTKVVVEKVSPSLYFVVPSAFDIVVQGKNLDKVSKVTLHGQVGTLTLTGNSALKIAFTEVGTKSIPPIESVKLEFFTKGAGSEAVVETLPVRIVRAVGG